MKGVDHAYDKWSGSAGDDRPCGDGSDCGRGGCSGGEPTAGKAGGVGPPLVLQMVNAYGDLHLVPGVEYFVSQVKERSGGNLTIEVTSGYGNYANDVEQQVVRGVAEGRPISAGLAHGSSTPWA